LGLVGVAIIMGGRIGAGPLQNEAIWGFGAVLVSAVLYGYNLILQRQQSLVATAVESAFFTNVFAVIVLATAAPFLAVVPSSGDWPTVIFSAGLAFASLLTLSWAYRRAEAQVLVPVEYTAFIWASFFGWWIFDEQVTLWTLAGTALIVAGCFIAARGKRDAIVV
jgi:S-adenosylmethionine uptake transporter